MNKNVFLIVLVFFALVMALRNPGIAKTPISCTVAPTNEDCVCFDSQKITTVNCFDTATVDYCNISYECGG